MSVLEGLDYLLSVEELKTLQARRARALDLQDWDLYRSCHIEDFSSLTMTDTPIVGVDQVIEALKSTLAGVTSVHHVLSSEITFTSSEAATGIWVLRDWLWWEQDGSPHWMKGWGHYHDGYEKRDGRWLFSSRQIIRRRVEHSPGARLTR